MGVEQDLPEQTLAEQNPQRDGEGISDGGA